MARGRMVTRITGYYRPVQNWNDGKREEFANRKVYDVAHSFMKKATESKEACACEQKPEVKSDELLLFTTKTCPNCKMAKMLLDRAGIKYTVIDAEDDKEMTYKYGVKKAPTLLVPNGDDLDRYDNASEIKRYIEGNK